MRLVGVDAPEYNRCGGPQAKKRLSDLIYDKRVYLKEEVQETFGRSLALVYLSNSILPSNPILVNELMLAEGWGRTDYRKNSQRDRLTAAFHYAKERQLGIFSTLCREPANNNETMEQLNNDCLIKGNIDKVTYKKFYHLPNCKHYNQIILEKDIGERYFCSEAEASAAGFLKASGCPP